MNANRLLVIDDEEDIREFIRDVAEGKGYDVVAVEEFDQFRSSQRSFDPSLIILDLQMPKIDGIEVLRFLARERSSALILLASGMDAKLLNTAKQLGTTHGLNMLGALQKPMLLADLEAMLETAEQTVRSISEDDLREAIDTGQLRVYYQPKTDLTSDGVWVIGSVEALVRWQHPELGLVMPDEFIPLAEKTGLIASLTDVVLRKALEQVKLWHDKGYPLSVAVNMAPQLLSDLEFPDRLSDLLSECQVDASALLLEVTESGAMADVALTMDILSRLRLKGIGLSIDDFGTGHSSLVELYRMPFSELKIDKSFVMDIGKEEEASIIVRSLVTLAHNLGLVVCAEGVETQQALDLLRSVGCEKAQGYFISKPIPETELIEFLRDGSPKAAE